MGSCQLQIPSLSASKVNLGSHDIVSAGALPFFLSYKGGVEFYIFVHL